HHGPLRGSFKSRGLQPAEHPGALRYYPRFGADIEKLLRGDLGPKSQPVYPIATITVGTRGTVRGRCYDNVRRGNCPTLSVHRARSVRRVLPFAVWGKPLSHSASRRSN